MLNGVDVPETCGHHVHKSKSRDSIGEDYGMTGRNIARYMRLNKTTDQIKEMVDDGVMAMVTAVELSYLSEEEQKQVCSVMEEHGGKIKNAQAVELHNSAGSLTADKVKDILVGDAKEKPVSDAKMFAQIKKKYFKGKSTDEIMGVLEQALTTWFAREGEVDVYKRQGYSGRSHCRDRTAAEDRQTCHPGNLFHGRNFPTDQKISPVR